MNTSILLNVSLMLVYMAVGFVLCKTKLGTVSHAKTMSGFLIYILGPSMIINSFINLEYSNESVIKIAKYFAVSLVLQISFFAILYLFLHKKYTDSKYRLMTCGSVLGNVGFIGMPIVQSVFPNDPIVLVYSSVNVMSMNLIVFTAGVYLITNNKKYITLKSAILNPTTIALFIALPIYILRVSLPEIVTTPISLFAKMVTPICMIVLGMRLSACDLKALFTRGFVYLTCALKLVAFPLFAFLLVHFLPFIDDVTKTTVVVLAMTPSGAIIESLAELHDCEQEFAANIVLLTTIICIASIPLMSLLLI